MTNFIEVEWMSYMNESSFPERHPVSNLDVEYLRG